MRHAQASSRGFTFVETMIVLAITSVLLVGAIGAFAGGRNHAIDGRVRTRAESELRSSLVSLVNFMRPADINHLNGFDGAGVATAPSILRVSGADHIGRTHEPEVTIEWRPDSRPVNGIAHPGAVYAVTTGGTARLLAKRVPQGGFQVRQQGANLVILLTTYYSVNRSDVIQVTDRAVIALRNKS